MADDILDELEDDFDDELSDVLEEEDDEEFDEEVEDEEISEKVSLISKITALFINGFKKILGSTKAIIIIAVSVVLLIGIALGLWLFVFKESPDDLLKPQQAEATDVDPTAPVEREIIFEDVVELEPFERIKLKTSSTMGRISLNVALELTDARYRKQIYSMEDRIRTIVTQQVENTTWLELRNPEGKIMLKYNMLQRVNAIFPKAIVRNIYFTFFIMQ